MANDMSAVFICDNANKCIELDILVGYVSEPTDMKHVIAGVGFIVLGMSGLSAWWVNFGQVMRGLLPFMLLLLGLVAVLSGFSRLNGTHDPQRRHGDEPDPDDDAIDVGDFHEG